MTQGYTAAFYQALDKDSQVAADLMVPWILSVTKSSSVIDIGCGSGVWLESFSSNGVKKILGVDGDWVSNEQLKISETSFLRRNLEIELNIEGAYDLAICLEVLEHLSPAAGLRIIKALAKLAPLVLFSASIPGQMGTGHINEQWPSYWREQFAAEGFLPIDVLRSRFWNDSRIAWWFRQNVILYARPEAIEANPSLKSMLSEVTPHPFDIVHPELYNFHRGRAMEMERNAAKPKPLFVRLKAKLKKLLQNRG